MIPALSKKPVLKAFRLCCLVGAVFALAACSSSKESPAPSTSSTSSSTSSTSSSTSSSTTSSTSSSSSGIAMEQDLTAGWRVGQQSGGESEAALSYVSGGVNYLPVALGDQLLLDLETPMNFNGAKLSFNIEVDSAFVESGSGLQMVFQHKSDGYPGYWDCVLTNEAMEVGPNDLDCTIPATGWNLEGTAGVQAGLQTVEPPDADPAVVPAGSVTILGLTITVADTGTGSSSSSSTSSSTSSSSTSSSSGTLTELDLSTGWRVGHSSGGETDSTLTLVSGGVTYDPKVLGDQLVRDEPTPDNFNSATLNYTFEVDQAFIDSESSLQTVFQQKTGAWSGIYCNIYNDTLTVGENTYTCTLPETDWDLEHDAGIQIGLQTYSESSAVPAGTVTITGLSITQLAGAEEGDPVAGAASFDSVCSVCHTDNDDGTFDGTEFDVNNLAVVPEQTQDALSAYIEASMPPSDPTLCDAQCAADVAAYLWGYVSVAPEPIVASVSSGWRTNPDRVMSYDSLGAVYSPTTEGDQFVFDLAGPVNLSGAEIVFEYEASAEYISSGANLQPFAQQTEGGSAQQFGCWVNNSDLALGTSTCSLAVDPAWNLEAGDSVQIGVQAKSGAAITGTLTITGVTINLAQ